MAANSRPRMILHSPRTRPSPWSVRKQASRRWATPLVWIEWVWEWAAYWLSNWAFLEVLEYLGTFSVLVAVIFYFSESGDRVKLRHYQAWQVINTAQGKGGSGGRIEALQELNEDRVPLVGVDVSSAFLQGVRLRHASLLRSDFSSADVRNGDLSYSNLILANLDSINLRDGKLDYAQLVQANLKDADLTGASLAGVDLSGATLDDADLRNANLQDAKWQQIKSIKGANIAGVKSAPPGFVEWALKNGAVEHPSPND
jgi:Pentapeptide repeats (8 copies)